LAAKLGNSFVHRKSLKKYFVANFLLFEKLDLFYWKRRG